MPCGPWLPPAWHTSSVAPPATPRAATRSRPDHAAWSRNTTMPTERYEILILGSGAGGKLLAWHMAGAGHRTAVVERRWIGGSCPNVNCLPSKNEIWSAKVADLVRHAADFGLVTGSYKTETMLGGLSHTVLRDAMLAHPTMAEGRNGLFGAIPAAARRVAEQHAPSPRGA